MRCLRGWWISRMAAGVLVLTVAGAATMAAAGASTGARPGSPVAVSAEPSGGAVYVGLGDSYSSGEGLGSYAAGTHTDKGVERNVCHRSADAYPMLTSIVLPTVRSRAFWACSGATSPDMMRPGPQSGSGEQYKQPAQVATVGSATRWISISAGGDDLGFGSIGLACAELVLNHTTVYRFSKTSCVTQLAEERRQMGPAEGNNGPVEGHLETLYSTLLKNAPGAFIGVLGYPRVLPATYRGVPVFNKSAFCVLDHYPWPFVPPVLWQTIDVGMPVTDAKNVDLFVRQMNTLIQAAIAHVRAESPGNAARIGYVDTYDASVPHNCKGTTPGATVAAFEISGAGRGVGSWLKLFVSTATFHPTTVGQKMFARQTEKAFLASQQQGTAIQVPGLAALNVGGEAAVNAVSCGSPGNCAAGGYYTDSHQLEQGFVADEVNGAWQHAAEVPGLGALNSGTDANAGVSSLSCASAGNCAAGGQYGGDGSTRGFVASEVNGVWQHAVEVPGLAALNSGDAGVVAVSCRSAGSCTAGGDYENGQYGMTSQAFATSEVNGTWRTAVSIPGLGTLETGTLGALVNSLSCGSPGSCVIAGSYNTSAYPLGWGVDQGFVADEVGGVWKDAIEVPGLGALDATGASGPDGGGGWVRSVSCASAGNCVAGGGYGATNEWEGGFEASEVNGTWGNALEVKGPGATLGGDVYSVSCLTSGNCAAIGGDFLTGEKNGVWQNAVTVPGWRKLGGGLAYEDSTHALACRSAGYCTVGGEYYVSAAGSVSQGFVSTEVAGTWQNAAVIPGLLSLDGGKGPSTVTEVACALAAQDCVIGGTYEYWGGTSYRMTGYVTS
jgi:hypothetical protein